MTRLIDADKLRAEYQAILDRGDMFCEYDIIGMVDNAPTVEERPHGKWELHRKGLRVWFECSNCGAYNGGFETDFCFCCGADMRGDNND